MGKYIETLCKVCFTPIGHRQHRVYEHDYDFTFFFHNDATRDCWEEFCQPMAEDYLWMMYRVTRKDVVGVKSPFSLVHTTNPYQQ